ncbi:MAG: hypothetical protein J6A16_08210, partial [Oscillospiraceae bacterium]|nr:hypothetical protein [Oscillospiraceae bacterium]
NTAESVPEGTDLLHPNKAMCKPYTFNALNEAAKAYSAERRRLHGDDCSSINDEKLYSTVGKMFCNYFSMTSTQNYEPSEKYYEFLNMFIESIASDPDIQDIFKTYMEKDNV